MKAFVIAAGLLATASAHATWQELWVNGVDQVGKCVRLPPSNSPVSSVDSTDIRCNVGGTKGMSGTCTVAGEPPEDFHPTAYATHDVDIRSD